MQIQINDFWFEFYGHKLPYDKMKKPKVSGDVLSGTAPDVNVYDEENYYDEAQENDDNEEEEDGDNDDSEDSD